MLREPTLLHGAIRRYEAVATLGEKAVRDDVRNGIFVQPWRGVIIERKRASDPLARAAAALLVAGPEAVLSHNTAALLHGCKVAQVAPVHITVPYTSWIRSKAGLIVHHDRYAQQDVELIQGLPTLNLAATMTELLCTEKRWVSLASLDQMLNLGTEQDAEKFVVELTNRLAERDNRKRVRIAESLLGIAQRGAESPGESRVRMLVLDAGFPMPYLQYPILTATKKLLYRLDMAWPEMRICLEYDGYEAHEERGAYDSERDQRLAGRGWVTIRVCKNDLLDPTRFLEELKQTFAQRKALLG